MKKILLSVSALLLLQAMPAPPNTAVELSSAWNEKNLEYKTKNNDYCDYSIRVNLDKVIGFDGPGSPYLSIVPRGENRLFVLKWDGFSTYSMEFTYNLVRGNFYKKPDVGFLYALPVKQENPVRIATKEGNDYTLLFNLQNASDTVYACRGGIVCDNRLSDTSAKGGKYDRSDIITLYHDDGTMADYTLGGGKKLIFPGDIIKVGDPIAVVKGRTVSVGIYFLDKNKFTNDQTGSKHTGFVPVFHTKEGDQKLLPNTTYRCEITDQMATADMSKREKAKYLKDKTKK